MTSGAPSDLPYLGDEPLRADLPTVAIQEVEPFTLGDFVQLVGFRLRGMVLPKLDPCMGMIPPFREET
jgi:hypothetical protein